MPDGRWTLQPSDPELVALAQDLPVGTSFPRPETHAIRFHTVVDGLPASIEDNIVDLEIEATDSREAKRVAEEAAAKFVRGLVQERGLEFFATLTQVTDLETREVRPLHTHTGDGGAGYSLRKMRRAMVAAAAMSSIDDPVLQKALIYMEQAQVLMGQAHFHPHLASRAFLIAPAYLNVWKAITVILGDPSSDRDYQSRFREFGFEKNFWRHRVKPVKDVRDSMDVAHYSLEDGVEKEIREAYWGAERLCRDIIRQYFAFRREGSRREV